MGFQPAKCNIMLITRKWSKKTKASYTLERTVLENVEDIKYLGKTIAGLTPFQTAVKNTPVIEQIDSENTTWLLYLVSSKNHHSLISGRDFPKSRKIGNSP